MTRVLTSTVQVIARLLAGTAAVTGMLALTSLANALHPALDSLSHFRMHLAALSVLCTLPLLFSKRRRRFAVLATGAAALVSAATFGPLWPKSGIWAAAAMAGGEPHRLLQANLRFDNKEPDRLFDLIAQTGPDILTFQEVSTTWIEQLSRLRTQYPHGIICERESRLGGVAILSRHPVAPGTAECVDDGLLAFATLEIEGRQIDVAALHLHWPWPFDQHAQAQWNARDLARLGETALLAGDFNAAPWSETTRMLAAGGGLTAAGLAGPTWLRAWMPNALRRVAGLPLDQVLVKGAIAPTHMERGPPIASDHLPILMDFALVR